MTFNAENLVTQGAGIFLPVTYNLLLELNQC